MAIDLFSPLKVVSWASAHANCPMRAIINSSDEMVIVFGPKDTEFEFAFDVDALRELLRLGADTLAKMDALADEANSSVLVATSEYSA
jgi:hypothetical protein